MQDRALVAKRMSAIRPSGGSADRALGRELWRRGLRYRRRSKLFGRPDLVFAATRIVVFVDSDFWHGRWLEERIARGDFQRNADYWIPKLTRNADRDRHVTQHLTDQGWMVIRVWESDVKRDLKSVADDVALEIQRRGPVNGTTSL